MREKIILAVQKAMLAGVVCVGLLVWVPGAPGQGNSMHGGKPVRVDCIVSDASGKHVATAEVILETENKSFQARGVTDAEGSSTFRVVNAGDYVCRAEKKGLGRSEWYFHVEISGEKRSDLIEVHLDLADKARTPIDGKTIEFDDKPNFTVAGVTEWNNAGMHGSDVSARTSEKLARETRALEEKELGRKSPAKTAAGAGETKEELMEAREELQISLAKADTAEKHRLLGEVNERLGDAMEAEREFERAARMEPSEENYFAWGTELLLHRADQPAAEVFLRGASVHKDSARMLEGLAAALFAEGKVEEAAKKLCEAADLRPKDETAYLFLGRIQKSSVKPLSCAEEKLARFARERPESAMANYYYGLTLWRRERVSGDSAVTADAEAHLAKAAKLDAKFGEASLQLGILHAENGKLEQAIGDFQNAVAGSPELGEAHYRLGLAYRRTKQEAKAEEEFRVYEKIQKEETAAREKERKELRQFLIILKGEPAVD